MILNKLNLSQSSKLENAIILSVILFIIKILLPVYSVFTLIISEVLMLSAIFLWSEYLFNLLKKNKNQEISLILNSGITCALIFFVLSVSGTVIDTEEKFSFQDNIVSSIFSLLVIFIFIYLVMYIFSVIRYLFFLRQKKEPGKYFVTMMIFMLLAALSNTLLTLDYSLDYIKKTFFFVSIILIVINSIRVSWIAFLTKKQKLYLLLISIILSVLFITNYGISSDNVFITQIISPFSPSFYTIFNLIMIYGGIYFGIVFFTALFHLPTAEAFDRKAVEVSSLMDLSKILTKVLDIKELAETITELTINVCNTDCSWLLVKRDDKFDVAALKNIGFIEANNISEKITQNKIFKTENILTLKNDELVFNFKEQTLQSQFRSLVAAKLIIHNQIKGYLVTARKSQIPFDDEDIKSISSFADYAAVALDNANLIKESIIKERLEKELDVAREIQYKILPAKTPDFKNIQISALFIPAFEVGGDYYDFFLLSENKLGFVIADVAGKGISAAFIMAEVKGIFETLSKLIESPSVILSKANEILINSLERKSFVTAIYGILDTNTGKLKFSRAGHMPLLLISDGEANKLTPPGLGLGLDNSGSFENSIKDMEIQLKYNDIVVLFTDGITESKNSDLEDYGYNKFENVILENKAEDPDRIANEIIKDVSTFSVSSEQHDDITLVLIKWKFNNFSLEK